MNNVDYEKIISLYKNSEFEDLKKEIDLLNDEEGVNLKTILLANALSSNKREDFSNELSDLSLYIINSGIDVNKKIIIQAEGEKTKSVSITYFAVLSGDADVLNAVLDKGADVNVINDSVNLLFFAIGLKDEKIMNILLDHNIDLMPNENHPSILNFAIASDQIKIAKKMLNRGYPFEKENIYSEDPIILALKYSNELVNMLLESNFKFTLKPHSTPLENYAIIAELIEFEIFEKIIKKIKRDIPDINYPVMKNIPALHTLIGKRLPKQIDLLLSMGVSPDVRVVIKSDDAVLDQQNISGFTPLMYAVTAGFNEIVDILVKYNANPNTKDLMGNLPVFVAMTANIETFLSIMNSSLLDLDENISEEVGSYINPLHYLAQIEQGENVMMKNLERADIKELINKPISGSLNSDINGMTPLMLACSVKNKNMILTLINNENVDINYKDNYGRTALYELLMADEFSIITDMNSNENTMNLINVMAKEDFDDVNQDMIKPKVIEADKLEIASEMIKKGCEIDIKVNNKKMVKLLPVKEKEFIKKLLSERSGGLFGRIFK